MRGKFVFVLIKNKFFLFIIGLAAIAAILTANWVWTAVSVFGNRYFPLMGRVIVVDPGHGGIDGGTNIDGRIKEKDLVLDIAQRVKTFLVMQGATVHLTRNDDRELSEYGKKEYNRHRRDLEGRVNIAKEKKADILVSIHVNHSRRRKTSGAMVFHQKNTKSAVLAGYLQQAFRKLQPDNAKKPRPRDYYLLRECDITTVLVEVGFLSNQEERELLRQDKYRDKVALTIAEGIKNFYLHWEDDKDDKKIDNKG